MKTISIDLENYRTKGSRVFIGRDRGIEVRNTSKIDTLATEYDEVIIKIPDDIGSINPSFLEEFLFNVVTKLKKEEFFQKIKFTNEGRYKIAEDVGEAVDRILREQNALSR